MSKHAITGLTKSIALDGREHNIACSQLDVGESSRIPVLYASLTSSALLTALGGAGTGIQGTQGKLQPDGTRVHEA